MNYGDEKVKPVNDQVSKLADGMSKAIIELTFEEQNECVLGIKNNVLQFRAENVKKMTCDCENLQSTMDLIRQLNEKL